MFHKRPVPRVAAVHDLSGFGRASLTVVIPVLSTMGVQVCPIPTAVLSTHTGGFRDYEMVDLTDHLKNYIAHWRSLNIRFDGFYTGFLGSPRQVSIIGEFIEDFTNNEDPEERLILIDPVMGDDGNLYSAIDTKMVEQMRRFVRHADIITPNFTEAALLLGKPYTLAVTDQEIKDWLRMLSDMGPRIPIITSVPDCTNPKSTQVMAYNREDGRFWRTRCDYIPAQFPGTGDVFASIIVGSVIQGDSLPMAIDRAVQFILAAIRASYGYRYPEREGILLERVLDNLKGPVLVSNYETVT